MCKTGKNPSISLKGLVGCMTARDLYPGALTRVPKNFARGDLLPVDELFEIGKNYVFYFYYGTKMGFQPVDGKVVSYDHPLVKIETKGLFRIINCTSSAFIEAIARSQSEELEELVLEKDDI